MVIDHLPVQWTCITWAEKIEIDATAEILPADIWSPWTGKRFKGLSFRQSLQKPCTTECNSEKVLKKVFNVPWRLFNGRMIRNWRQFSNSKA